MNENKITLMFSQVAIKILKNIVIRHNIKLADVISHALVLVNWAEAADKNGDIICLKNGRTGKITEMNFLWPKPQTKQPEQTPKLVLINCNPNAKPSPPRLLPPLQSVIDPTTDSKNLENK
ncbi:MAG: hypothetical protein COU29_01480 [Candidatus Magasanikbacteria bacterium CG10_big_fil_rev_8_21_14_0_10_36_32]|uniref:Uncharacterized protein n=1 Tax=Candidatus Magasanikbacteria bacterium CG10_big_fil_rev_8_21_14_0_10_36_32 TaxID=1974646 RepID=A0A2M6W6P2_9BACT|nr:MAG: hypothetical protein COU29_01480 [Candidatus Magasanikbacteria bacterium CG10_big_fil_rev_8_21_14_0_10_36_32]